MSLEQLSAYLMTDDAKKQLVSSAREAGFEVTDDDLEGVAGGLAKIGSIAGDNAHHMLRDIKDANALLRKDSNEGTGIIFYKDANDVKDGYTLKDGGEIKD